MVEVALLLLALSAPSGGPLVVLDPGHGGAKAGAKNAGGTSEKAIVWEVAKAAKAELERAGLHVVLTREGDRDVPLQARVELANRMEASAFVSIHANSSPVESRRGLETYVVAAEASDDEAAQLAEVENEEEAAPVHGPAPESDLEGILLDLKQERARAEAAELAGLLQKELGGVGALLPSRGLRQAPFLVLRAARMPAALVELGYLTHGEQGQELADLEVQKRAGRALGRALVRFLSTRVPDAD